MLRDKLAAMLAAVILAVGYCHDARADGLPKGGLPIGEVAKASTSWSGLYIGGNVGYGWTAADHAQTNGGMKYGPFDADGKGFMGGLMLGYNWQFGFLVAGIEIEGGYMDTGGDGRIPSSSPGHYQAIDVDGGFYGLAAGRLGIAWDKTLLYGKGGYVYIDGNVGQATTKSGFETHRSENLQGVVYGAGIEYAFSPRLTARLEWLRFDLDTVTGSQESITDVPVGYLYTNKTDVSIDTVKFGLSFKLN